MRSLSPSNCGQYAARPIPNTPTRARGRVGADSVWAPVSGEEESVTVNFVLEVELVDVALVERRQRAEHNLAVLADRVLAETPGLELLALLAADAARDERRRGLPGEVADVLGHPQLELVHGAVLDVLAHLVREAEPGELDLALLRRRRQVARGRGHAHRGRGDDALEVRIRRQQPLRLLEGLLVVVVAVGDLHELDVLVLRLLERVLHDLDPSVLVRRVCGRGQDRDLALV